MPDIMLLDRVSDLERRVGRLEWRLNMSATLREIAESELQ